LSTFENKPAFQPLALDIVFPIKPLRSCDDVVLLQLDGFSAPQLRVENERLVNNKEQTEKFVAEQQKTNGKSRDLSSVT